VTGRWPWRDREVGEPIAPSSRLFRRVPERVWSQETFLMATPRIVVIEEQEVRVGASPG
jgi:hypothetical protein